MTLLPTVALGDIADINPRLGDAVAGDNVVSFVGMASLDAATGEVAAQDRQYQDVSKGFTAFRDLDLLVAKITPCFENGKVAQARLPHPLGFGSTEFHIIRAKDGLADARYLMHFLRQEQVRRSGEQSMTGSAGQRRVPVYFLASLLVPLPPLPEQRRIADVLDRVEALRAKRRAALARLETLSQSIFLDMFGDPIGNPKGWPSPELEEVMTFQQYGPRFHNRTYSPDGTRIVRITDLNEAGNLTFENMPRLPISAEDLSRYAAQPGDILFARTGATVGKVALIRDDDPPCIAGAYFITMRFLPEILPVYVRSVLTSSGVRQLIARRSRQAAQQNFSGPALRRLPIPVPPLRIQERFVRIVTVLDRVKARHQASLTHLDSLFESIQHRAFRGEL